MGNKWVHRALHASALAQSHALKTGAALPECVRDNGSLIQLPSEMLGPAAIEPPAACLIHHAGVHGLVPAGSHGRIVPCIMATGQSRQRADGVAS